MKRWLVVAWVALGMTSAVRGQEATPISARLGESSTQSYAKADTAKDGPLPATNEAVNTSVLAASSSPMSRETAHNLAELAAPEPPKLYSSRDDYRWQLGVTGAFVRFQPSIIDASLVGVNTSVAYYTNEWFAMEGSVTAAFAPTIFQNEHVKYLDYMGGVKMGVRKEKWGPWAHALVGGAHLQPQTAGNSKNAFAVKAGGGVDYRLNQRLSLRGEGDWVRTQFFKQSQNDFQAMIGVVIHF